MKLSKLASAGFLAYAASGAVWTSYTFLSGRAAAGGVHLRPIGVVVGIVWFSLLLGALGAVVGMGFSLFHRWVPGRNLYPKGVSYNLVVSGLLLAAKSSHWPTVSELVLSIVDSVLVGLAFVWLYSRLCVERAR